MGADIVAQGLARGAFADALVAAYEPAKFAHTSAGVVALLAGATALLFHKGETAHRLAGAVFAVSIFVVGLSGPLIAESRVSFLTAPLAAYFVATAWRSARRREESSIAFEAVALLFSLGLASFYFLFGAQAAASPGGQLDGYPASFHYAFGGIAAFAALLDLNVVLRKTVSWAPRIARHLWRTCFALFFAGASFFIGQADRHPEYIRDSGVLVPIAFAPLVFLFFWLVSVRVFRTTKLPPVLVVPGRIVGVVYLIAIAVGLFALFRPRGV
jgi:uncharacterized membrane protein